MTRWRVFWSRLRQTFRLRRGDAALDDELRTHLELLAAEHTRRGMSPIEAQFAARRDFGGVQRVRETYRDQRGFRWVDDLVSDVRYALRTLSNKPAFTAAVLLTLALGIGANTAIFSLIDALMLRWLPVRDPQELVLISMRATDSAGPNGESFSYAIVRALAEQHDIFAGVGGFSGYTFNADTAGSTSKVPGALVTGGFYSTLGLHAAAGRLIGAQDDEPGAPLVAVISDGWWERRFNRNPAAIGQSLRLNSVLVTIIGVSPPGFVGANVGSSADITLPVAALRAFNPQGAQLLGPGNFWLRVLARPAQHLSLSETTARLAAVWPRIADSVLATNWPREIRAAFSHGTFELLPGGTGWTVMRDMYRRPLLVLMSIVGLVLVIACANIASLLLARASSRKREIAVRVALGASGGRIVRQLLVESTVLALLGGGLGILVAWTSGQFVLDMFSTGPLRVDFNLTPNAHVLAFTGGLAVATGLLFGLAPALHAAFEPQGQVMGETGRMTASRSRWLSALLVAQVAVSLLLLVGAGLFVRTLRNLQTLDLGFNPHGVMTIELQGRRSLVPLQLIDDIRHIPGVVSATVATHTPLSGARWSDVAVAEHEPMPERDNALFVGAGPRFFETMQTRMVAGREFTDADTSQSPPVAIVSETFARRHFRDRNPLGEVLSTTIRGARRRLVIVGVSGNVSAIGLRLPPYPTVYVPYSQLPNDVPTHVEFRTTGSQAAVAGAVQRMMESRLPETVIDVTSLSTQVDAAMVQERLVATLAGGFGVLGLVLACVGVYGLLAYTVAGQMVEIAIRLVLGAPRRQIVAMVLSGVSKPIVGGVLLGLPVAALATRPVQSMLFGLAPADPTTTIGAVVALAIAALAAAWPPVRRATRVDPAITLRRE